MIEVLPAIIEDTYEEVEKKLKLVAPYVDWVQIDVGDGMFVAHRTWTHIEDLSSIHHSPAIDLHLMVEDPHAYVVRAFTIPQIQRITFHIESPTAPVQLRDTIKRAKREVGVALNPNTSLTQLSSFHGILDVLLLMGVHPGWGGQEFIPHTCERIREARELLGGVRVGVDGGVHLATGTAQSCVDAGADYLVVGTDIFNTQNPGEMIKRLRQLTPSK
ncbi:MAG: hypothetical protein AB1352_05430 [Patescibacteria group bacterium]